MKLDSSLQMEMMEAINIGEWMSQATSKLRGKSEFPSVETYAIASHVLNRQKEWLIAHPDTEVAPGLANQLDHAVERLLNGEPLAYILGKWSFFCLDFFVDPNVLIPRPETELLVEQALRWLKFHPSQHLVADVGTGSGAIAIAVAANAPGSLLTAIDSSPDALKIAQKNIKHHHMEDQVYVRENNLLEGMNEKFDLILANLPYIPSGDLSNLAVSRFEPHDALDGGTNGLDLITCLIDQSLKNLLPGGCIFLEIQYNQANDVCQKASEVFPDAILTTLTDLANKPRIIKIQS